VLPSLVGLPCPPPERGSRPRPQHHHSRGAAGHVTVVARVPVGVGERGVGHVQPIEPLVAAATSSVRVHLPGQTPVRRLDLAPTRPGTHIEHFVVRPPGCHRRRL
uniref:Uncharacterized protein n=1 Tax=Triticum urartu TaxID=4572 RepID=A0A8R7V7K0_TRIUA